MAKESVYAHRGISDLEFRLGPASCDAPNLPGQGDLGIPLTGSPAAAHGDDFIAAGIGPLRKKFRTLP